MITRARGTRASLSTTPLKTDKGTRILRTILTVRHPSDPLNLTSPRIKILLRKVKVLTVDYCKSHLPKRSQEASLANQTAATLERHQKTRKNVRLKSRAQVNLNSTTKILTCRSCPSTTITTNL